MKTKSVKSGLRTVLISDIDLTEYYQRKDRSVDDLKDSISNLGIISPIVVSNDLMLRVGGRRLQALKQLGHTEAKVLVSSKDEQSQRLMSLDDNLKHKSYSQYEMSEILKMYRDIEIQRGNGYKYEKSGKKGGKRVKGMVKKKAKEMGISISQTHRYISRAERSANSVKKAFKEDRLKASAVDKIIRFNKADQTKLLSLIEKKPNRDKIQILNFAFKNSVKKARLDIDSLATHPSFGIQKRASRLSLELSNMLNDLSELSTYPKPFFEVLRSLGENIADVLSNQPKATILRKNRDQYNELSL